jgi:hypothetical protein
VSPLSCGWAQRRLTFLYLCIGEEEDTPTRKWVTCSKSLKQRWSQQRLTFLYLFIGEEEDTPNRKIVKWIESLKRRLDTVEADISVLVYR